MSGKQNSIAAETEAAVVGALLRDYVAAVTAEPELRNPEQIGLFGNEAYAALFAYLTEAAVAGADLSLGALTLRLHDSRPDLLAALGGPGNLTALAVNRSSVPALLSGAVEALKAAERRRRAVRLMMQAKADLDNTLVGDPEGILEWLNRHRDAIDGLYGTGARQPDWESWLQALRRVIEQMQCRMVAAQQGQPEEVRASTGFRFLDEALGGFRPERIYVLGGRTSTGKTALALQMGCATAAAGIPVGIVNLEMTNDDVLCRALAAESGLDAQLISEDVLHQHECGQLLDAASTLQEWPIMLLQRSRIKLETLLAELRHLHRKTGVQLVIIDYLQLIRPSGQGKWKTDKRLEVAESIGSLKALSQELKIAVLLLSQLKRDAEETGQKQPRRPRLSDLSESGSIENDADAVMLLHRPNRSQPDTELLLAKNRRGRIAKGKLRFIETTTKFEEVDDEPRG